MREARSRWVACAALLAAALALPVPALGDGPWHAEPAAYGVSAPVQQMVTMSDGVQLAADVYRPMLASGADAPGRFPVILSQTPYGKRSVVTTQSMGQGMGGDGFYPYLVQRGYIDVVADVRGAGSSDGDFSLFGPREMQDGVELANWAARLPGSDGAVGLAGSSYVGLNQLYTAALAGPHSPIKAIVPATVGNDLYRDLVFGGGIPDAEFSAVWDGLRASMVTAPPDEPQQNPQALVDHPASRAENFAEFDAQLYAEVETGGPRSFENGFWSSRAPSAYLDRIVRNGVPALLVSGWHDVYQRGAVLDYAGLQNAWSRLHGGPGRPAIDAPPMTASQTPTPRYQLVAGPWFHNPTTLGLTFQQLQLAWFDRWLKGIHDGIDQTSTPLHVFELGVNRWIDAERWPLTQTRAHTYYLGAGTLGSARPPSAGSDTLPWSDVRSPCNAGTDQWSTGLPALAIAELGAGGDPCADNDQTTQAGALVYTSAPFTTATTVAGPIDATVFVQSSTPDAELLASVDVVSPDGSSRPISSGALLGSLRAVDRRRSWREDGRLILPWHPYTSASARDMQPGAVERLEIEVYPTVARIAPGDSLRLTLSSGDTALQPTPVQATRLAGGEYSIE
ncbi:MAG TPA: CocE/NonD family hydrolase, partial [Solirubrobacteraceae bacterium]|nr:CocE/NonD family hydrolase [Solirubrobacteraceae bacterium]